MNIFLRRTVFLIKPIIKTNNLLAKRIMSSKFVYPEARRDETVKDKYNDIEIIDPYRWLEDPDADETKKYVDAQNAITIPYLNQCKEKEQIRSKITKLWNYPKYSVPSRHGKNYFQYRNSGLQNQSVIYIMKDLQDEGKVFFDPNTLSEDGTVALSFTEFTEDGKTIAYGLSASGSDWIEVHFKNVETGENYPDVLKKVKYSSLTWMHDNQGVFYGGYLHQGGKVDGSETKASENQKLYYHKLGTDQSEDICVLEFEDSEMRMSGKVSDCGKYLVVSPIKGCKNNLLYIGELPSKITEKLTFKPIVTKFEADFDYVTNDDTLFYIKTNKDAPNYRIISISLNSPEEEKWSDLISSHHKDVLDWAMPIDNNKLVVCYLRDVKNVLQCHDLATGKKIHDFDLEMGTIGSVSGERSHSQLFYNFSSFLTPGTVYQVDFAGDKISTKLFHETVVGDFDKSKYETKQVFYKSKDGTEIPMFLVCKKGIKQDGSNPCLLYGYGGFNVNLTPSFGISRLIFINNFDGIFALANIRGGGEYGDRWHNGGRFDKKQNCFDDFQSAAKYLVQEKYTTSSKLIIQGGSNGGLLVGACINQAPELFGAAICQVGVLDMLRYHKFTIGYAWKTDYGSSDDPEQFKYLIKYSPLHNVRVPTPEKQYPATLLLTADHDDRVVPLHSLKFIAELQHKAGNSPAQTNPLMIRVETRAGHGAGKPTTKLIDEVTDNFCFVSNSLNLPFKN